MGEQTWVRREGASWVGEIQHCSTIKPAGEQDWEASLRVCGKPPIELEEETSGLQSH